MTMELQSTRSVPIVRSRWRAVLALATMLTSVGGTSCGGGLNLRLINSSARRPSNVAVYFAVDAGDDRPIPKLTPDKFVIYEDGGKVSEFESKQTILNPKIASAHYTLLLLDMSGSITEAKQQDAVIGAAQKFTERVEKQHKVAVMAFDGSTDLYSIAPFSEGGGARASLERLRSFKPRDPSTNLHGAVLEGLKSLRQALKSESKPLKFGTLVVFTDGSDRANRVTRKQMLKEMEAPENKGFDIFAIGVGAEMADAKLEEIGRTATIKEKDQTNMTAAFERVAAKIENMTERYYLLSYCTPSRAGAHAVRIVINYEGLSGDLEYKFNADGFGPNCDPNTPPDFDLSRPVLPPKGGAHGGASVKVEVKAGVGR